MTRFPKDDKLILAILLDSVFRPDDYVLCVLLSLSFLNLIYPDQLLPKCTYGNMADSELLYV